MRNVSFLVVDDCPTVVKIMRKALRHNLGAEMIFEATDGLEAMNVMATEKIDIIISDWEMPKMNGEDLLLKIRKTPKYKNIPFIMMTSHGERNFVLKAIQNGANSYLNKPFSSEKLVDAIRKSWNGTNKRQFSRHACLPLHKLTLTSAHLTLTGEALDISRTGALVRMPYSDDIRLFTELSLNITFEDIDLLDVDIKSLTSSIVRINAAESHDSEELICEIGLSFPTDDSKPDSELKLDRLIEYLSTFGQEMIANAKKAG